MMDSVAFTALLWFSLEYDICFFSVLPFLRVESRVFKECDADIIGLLVMNDCFDVGDPLRLSVYPTLPAVYSKRMTGA